LEPIGQVFNLLEQRGVDIGSCRAVELFGRSGEWHTLFYADLVRTLDIWEIDSAYLPALETNFPAATLKITDSFEEIKRTPKRFDLIVADNPQSIYGERRYCEHFELFPDVFRVANDRCVILLDVNIKPYQFEKGSEWWSRRQAFYRTETPDLLDLGKISPTYDDLCQSSGFTLDWSFTVPRNDFIYYLLLGISRGPSNKTGSRNE